MDLVVAKMGELHASVQKFDQRKAGEPVNFFVTRSPTQAALPFCAGWLVAASVHLLVHVLRKVNAKLQSRTSAGRSLILRQLQ